MRPPPPPSASSAKTLILVGLIFQILGAIGLAALSLFALIVPILAIVLIPLAGLAILWVVLVYLYSYRRVADGDYEGARTPTLVFAILSLLTLSLLSGILYIIGYAQIGSAIQEQRASMAPYGMSPAWGVPATPTFSPAATAPVGTRFCSRCGRPNPVTSQFCNSCGAPMT